MPAIAACPIVRQCDNIPVSCGDIAPTNRLLRII